MQVLDYQQWWESRRGWFGVFFQEYVDEKIASGQSINLANFKSEDCE
jgi:hypothetical protein